MSDIPSAAMPEVREVTEALIRDLPQMQRTLRNKVLAAVAFLALLGTGFIFRQELAEILGGKAPETSLVDPNIQREFCRFHGEILEVMPFLDCPHGEETASGDSIPNSD